MRDKFTKTETNPLSPIKVKQEELQGYIERIELANKTKKDLDERNKKYAASVEIAREKAEEAKAVSSSTISRLDEDVKNAQKSAGATISEITAKIQEANSRYDSVSDRIKALQVDYDAIIAKHDAEEVSHAEKIESWNNQIADKKAAVSELQGQESSLYAQIKIRSKDIRVLEEYSKIQSDKLEAKRAEVAEMEKNLNRLNALAKEQEKAQQSAYKKQADELQKEVTVLMADKKEAEAVYKVKQEALQQLTKQTQEMQKKYDGMNSEVLRFVKQKSEIERKEKYLKKKVLDAGYKW